MYMYSGVRDKYLRLFDVSLILGLPQSIQHAKKKSNGAAWE